MLRKYRQSAAYLAAVALSVASAAATPAFAFTEFRGGGYVSNFSGCEEHGWGSQDAAQVVSRLRPAGLEGNDPTITSGTVNFGMGTHIYQFAGAPEASWTPVDLYTAWAWPNAYTAGEVQARMLPGSTTTIDATTHRVLFRAEIDGFDGLAGCTAELNVVLIKRD